jgi:hypothetical protein
MSLMTEGDFLIGVEGFGSVLRYIFRFEFSFDQYCD